MIFQVKLPTDRFPAKIIDAYKNGGNPTLDGGNYTVFGQVIDGMDVVDKNRLCRN